MNRLPTDGYSPAELAAMIEKMEEANSAFYYAAQRTGVHQFIEFTGLQADFIVLCKKALEAGQDFTQTSIHAGGALPAKGFHAAYVAEKLGCIYGTTFREPELREVFLSVFLGDAT